MATYTLSEKQNDRLNRLSERATQNINDLPLSETVINTVKHIAAIKPVKYTAADRKQATTLLMVLEGLPYSLRDSLNEAVPLDNELGQLGDGDTVMEQLQNANVINEQIRHLKYIVHNKASRRDKAINVLKQHVVFICRHHQFEVKPNQKEPVLILLTTVFELLGNEINARPITPNTIKKLNTEIQKELS